MWNRASFLTTLKRLIRCLRSRLNTIPQSRVGAKIRHRLLEGRCSEACNLTSSLPLGWTVLHSSVATWGNLYYSSRSFEIRKPIPGLDAHLTTQTALLFGLFIKLDLRSSISTVSTSMDRLRRTTIRLRCLELDEEMIQVSHGLCLWAETLVFYPLKCS